jgi:hypothetical protein
MELDIAGKLKLVSDSTSPLKEPLPHRNDRGAVKILER